MTIDASVLSRLDERQARFLVWQKRWGKTARPNQVPEVAAALQDKDPQFTECGYLAGRGYGKTRVGAEWLARKVFLDPSGFDSAVIAPTYQDVKFTCFENGLLDIIPPELVKAYNKTDMTIEMFNCTGGVSLIRGFTAEKPERLRGPQHTRIWADELAAWPYDDVWDMAMMGLRLGDKPQVLWTTTPKPKDIIHKLTAPNPGRLIVAGSTSTPHRLDGPE